MRLLWASLTRMLRDILSRDLLLIAIAVVVAVTSVVSVSAYSDRVQRAIDRAGAELIAADLVLSSELDLDPAWQQQAQARQLQTANTVVVRSIVVSADNTSMAEVKAVSSGYPLRGTLTAFDSKSGEELQQDNGPAAGSVWIDRELADALKVQPGATISVGNSELTFTSFIGREPDRASIGFSIAPRLLMALADLPDTGLTGPGALADNNLLIAGDLDSVSEYKLWISGRVTTGVEIRDPATASPRLGAAIERSERFLSLAALVSVLLAGAAIARLGVIFVEREANAVALLRGLGARSNHVTTIYIAELLLLGLIASVAGVMIGYLGQAVLARILADMMNAQLPAPGWRPALVGMCLGLISLLGFCAPALSRMRKVSPLRLMTRRPGFERAHPALEYGVTGLLAIAFIFWIARDWRLASWVTLGVIAALAAFGVVSLLIIAVLGKIRPLMTAAYLRHGIANITRRPRDAVTQVTALGIGVMSLLLLTYVKDDLFKSWQQRLPSGTPNHFFVNVLPEQRAELKDLFGQMGLSDYSFSPMVKARLNKVNDKIVTAADFEEGFARRMVTGAANLSWAERLESDNRVVSGEFKSSVSGGLVPLSVELDYAEALGLSLGDNVQWLIEGSPVNSVVTSLREVDWDSFRPNFFLLVPPRVLDEFSTSYIGSIYVPETLTDFRRTLISQFPNIADVDLSVILKQVRGLLDRLNQAMTFIFVFTLAAGLLVLLACVLAVERQRRRDIAVIKTVGGSKQFISRSLVLEFVVLGLLAGGVGALMATLAGFFLAERVLKLEYTIDPTLWLVGLIGGAVVVAVAGLVATRTARSTAPWMVLR